MDLNELKRRVAEAAGQRSVYEQQLAAAKKAYIKAMKEKRLCEAAIAIVTAVGETLQQRISIRLSSVASRALQSVFPDPYRVVVEFAPTARGTIEAQIQFERDGQRFRPVLPSGQLLAGGGPVEMAAWGLRVALWGQLKPRPRPIMLMDEPFRFLQEDLQPVAAEVLREISEKAGIQFIIVTHSAGLAEGANCIIDVGRRKVSW
jgi:predicted ATPase